MLLWWRWHGSPEKKFLCCYFSFFLLFNHSFLPFPIFSPVLCTSLLRLCFFILPRQLLCVFFVFWKGGGGECLWFSGYFFCVSTQPSLSSNTCDYKGCTFFCDLWPFFKSVLQNLFMHASLSCKKKRVLGRKCRHFYGCMDIYVVVSLERGMKVGKMLCCWVVIFDSLYIFVIRSVLEIHISCLAVILNYKSKPIFHFKFFNGKIIKR